MDQKKKRKEGRVEGRKPTGRFGDVHTRPGYRTRPRLRSIQLPEYFVERSGVTTIIHESVIMHGNHTEPGRDAQPSVALLCNRLHPAMPEIKGEPYPRIMLTTSENHHENTSRVKD